MVANASDWNDHILNAARAFVKAAVTIDDQAASGNDNTISSAEGRDTDERGASVELSGALGRGRRARTAKAAPVARSETPAASDLVHPLDLASLTDGFANNGIVCGPLVPSRTAIPDNPASVRDGAFIERACKLAETADIMIVDWFLSKGNASTSVKIITEIIKKDFGLGGRVRLICVYTGVKSLESVKDSLRDALNGSDFVKDVGTFEDDDSSRLSIKLKNSRIVFVNKPISGNAEHIAERDLATALLEEFSKLINGLLPSFAAASIGAIRDNTHRVLDVFSREMDAAYVGNRAITDPSEEVGELVREMLISERDSVVGLAGSADRSLNRRAIDAWMRGLGRPRTGLALEGKRIDNIDGAVKQPITRELVLHLVDEKVSSPLQKLSFGSVNFRINESQTRIMTQALSPDDASASIAEERFARLASTKREAFGIIGKHPGWRPSMTLGTLVKQISESTSVKYFMCINRACDMVRLKTRRQVALLELTVVKSGYNLIVPGEDSKPLFLRVPMKFANVVTPMFLVDEKVRRIRAISDQPTRTNRFIFREDSEKGGVFLYLGELRYLRALRDVSEFVKNSTSIGISDSEWLRLHGRQGSDH